MLFWLVESEIFKASCWKTLKVFYSYSDSWSQYPEEETASKYPGNIYSDDHQDDRIVVEILDKGSGIPRLLKIQNNRPWNCTILKVNDPQIGRKVFLSNCSLQRPFYVQRLMWYHLAHIIWLILHDSYHITWIICYVTYRITWEYLIKMTIGSVKNCEKFCAKRRFSLNKRFYNCIKMIKYRQSLWQGMIEPGILGLTGEDRKVRGYPARTVI